MKKGFTLIEMLIYIALLAIISVLIINSMLFLVPSYNSLKVTRDINNAAVSTLERITREVKSASGVDVVNSVFDVQEGKLVLNDGTSIYLSGGRVYIQEGSGDPNPLTRKEVTVTDLTLEHFIGTESEAVQVRMTVEGSRRNITKTGNFHTAATLRN